MLTRILLITLVLMVSACGLVPKLDQVIPDRRTEYQKSESLPDLEVPPDLTREGLDDPLAIPNEQATTLSEFERQKSRRRSGAPASAFATVPDTLANENYVVVQGSRGRIWSELRKFWQEQGYTLELDDPELGVMETAWKESDASGLTATRHRYTLFSEDGGSDSTLLLVSNERQERIDGAGGGEDSWITLAKDSDGEKQVVTAMNLYFYGTETPGASTGVAAGSTPAAEAARAEVLDLGEQKYYLSLPEEFTRAWSLTQSALQDAGMIIEKQDRSKGLYYVLYFSEEAKDEGFFDKLAFWSNDPESKPYQISLTGVGEKTELVVLDKEGEWEKGQDATRILSLLQSQYNRGR